RAQEFGVLQAVKLHVRSRHAFAEPSTSQELSTGTDDTLQPSSSQAEPARAQLSNPPAENVDPYTSEFLTLFGEINDKSDPTKIRIAIQKLHDPSTPSTVHDWNAALKALIHLRKPGEPATDIIETYNALVARAIDPSATTLNMVIEALCDRDYEVQRIVDTLEWRNRKRIMAGLADAPEVHVDTQHISDLRAEANFVSAISLFEASATKSAMPLRIYSVLLRACAHHKAVDSAIRVFSHLENRRKVFPTASVYDYLIAAYTSVGDLEGAKVVFDEFRNVSRNRKIHWHSTEHDVARQAHIGVWNSMIDAYFRANDPSSGLELLEQMLDTPKGVEFEVQDVPTPSLTTYTTIIEGFCRLGDMQTALSWFERLLEQDSVAAHPFKPTATPPRPDSRLWQILITALLEKGMINDANRLFEVSQSVAKRDGLVFWWWDRAMMFHANLRHLEENTLEDADAIKILDFLFETVLGRRRHWGSNLRELQGSSGMKPLISRYAIHGRPDKSLEIIQTIAEFVRTPNPKDHLVADQRSHTEKFQKVVEVSDALLLDDNKVLRELPLPLVLRLASVWKSRGIDLSAAISESCLRAYAVAKASGESLVLSVDDWNTIAFASGEPISQGDVREHVFTVLTDMAREGVDPSQLSPQVMDNLIHIIVADNDHPQVRSFLESLGPAFEALLTNYTERLEATRTLPAPLPIPSPVQGDGHSTGSIDVYHSRFVDEYHLYPGTATLRDAFARFESGLQSGMLPTPATLARLIDGFGRLKDMGKVYALYNAAQHALSLLDAGSELQTSSWIAIENAMVVSHGHAGDGPRADMHRMRLIEHGASPSADAYGALIQSIKETTDDTARAMAYFEESQMRGVAPNIFLYNTTISKLAKARKADYAIELFQRMKTIGLRPSSITYGAIIAACCRVGDSMSAEALFAEMVEQPQYKPRVPPFNTMMQFYVQTKPNLPRFLHYLNAMQKAGIRPTAHTYKLMIDAHGTIEPVNVPAMEQTFHDLVADRNVPVQGSHWAALINAYGCVAKDLQKAIDVFESIATHPSTVSSGINLPDAVVYESLINVFITLRRTDLVADYIVRMRGSGVHMTAYVANLLIRSYASVGDIEGARQVFEGLLDPPVGVAAPNNHAPHQALPSRTVSPDAPVYREPSTWEAMVRAELGNGNRDRAVALLERIQARGYPESIYNRISGIMLDDSVSPWPS
ncbi:hypothetical protein HETIRDRAFT_235203, partial [Heterobasidion irregulare TC 32-1]